MENQEIEIEYLELLSIQLGINEKAAEKCPRATQDIGVNLRNRGSAIKTAMYGPLNPAEPNTEYWDKLGKEWDVDAASAKKQLCGNCSLFIQTPSMKSCIKDGVTGGERKDEWEAIDSAGELGYCEAFDFKCASKRTCRAWVTGGPITSEKKNTSEEKSFDDSDLPKFDEYYSTNVRNDINEKALYQRKTISEATAAKSEYRNPKGGLTAAGRKYFKRTQGANLKPGVKGPADTPEKMRRKGSFLTRFFTNPSGPMKDEKGRPTRLALSAAAWGEPVPQDMESAAKLAEKGRGLLKRYESSKKKKK
ncbi:hypothetical protein UFOVP658_109 [uncultured Caudovirales phage]|uniref:DUF6321 domain-containing protein n=1 Tax=uncultured Caudovirales phage TaxID=2100421 RepID=A0A6J5NGP8_9CAUD|nr:hypothetical protein UFOVP658_109 [uncultured Caudovirales phage]